MTLAQKINGKKRYVAIPLVFLVTIIGASVKYGELRGQVETNSAEIEELDDMPEQMARVEERVNGTDKTIDKMYERQSIMENDIKEIYKAVVK